MEKTLQIINQMQKENVFEKYMLGGGIAAIFYIEPVTTFDLPVTLADKELINKIFENKEKFHQSQAKLPIEEKTKILVELQKIEVKIQKHKNLKVWEI